MKETPRSSIELKSAFAATMGKKWEQFKVKYGDEKTWKGHDLNTLKAIEIQVSTLIAECEEESTKRKPKKEGSDIAAGWKAVLKQAKQSIEWRIIERANKG